MKRLIALSMVVVALPLMAKTWYDENTGYTWTYQINGDTAEIYGTYDYSTCTPAISPKPTGSVTIPSTLGGKTVTSVGAYAFYYCNGLASVTIPNSVKSIGEGAFQGCGLTSVTIPDGVTIIGDEAFSYCVGITNVTISKSVINIGYEAFAFCNLEEITLPFVGSRRGNSGSADSLFGYIFAHYPGKTRQYYSDDSYIECIIPSSLKKVIVTDETVLGYGAFYKCKELTSITISDSVTNIGTKAFFGCNGLTSVTIPNSVTSIGEGAFRGCGLTSVTIPNSVTDIGMGAFCGCSGLVQIIMPFVGARRGNSGWSDSLFGYIFYGGELGLFGVYRGPGWSPDPGYYTPYIPSGLRSIVITDETVIGCKAFYRCSGLRNLTIPDSVTSIGDEAFYDCNGLMRLTIPDSVTSIGAESFSRCSGLGSVTIPDSVTSIGDGAFWGCSGLTSVTIPQCVCDSRLSTVFRSCDSIKNVIISEGVTSVADDAFYNCSGLTSVTIPDSVVNIGDNAFKGCNGLSKVTIPNVVCASTISTVFPSAYQSIREIVLPDSATGLGEGLFSGCRMLSSVTIPKGVVSIGDFTFSECSNLEGVEIPYGVKNFGAHAFAGCVALENVTIPYSIKQLGDYAFSGCSSLHRIVLPGWLRGTFDESTFSGNADDFEIVYIDGVGICVNANDMGFSEGEHCLWSGDRDISHDGIASARLKGRGQSSESSIELQLDSPGRLSFWWKASSESDGNKVFDYAYLSIDGVPQGTLIKGNGEYSLNGVAIGGKTDWRHEVIDVAGKGSHVIRWTYAKDEIDEGDIGEDCAWLDQVAFTPLAYLSFDIAGASGTAPSEISELEGEVVTLPAQSGFVCEDHVFNGWSDGKATYAAESQYVVPASNVTFTAQWIAKRFLTFALDGGDGQIPIAIKDVPGADITLPSANGISRTKHVFVGWSDGATTYDAGANYRVTDASVEFKAVWQRKEAHVSIVSDDVVNGGTVDTQGATISMSAWTNPSVGTPAIYYTLDGTEPTTSSTRYEGPFFVGTLGDVTVRALAVLDDCFEGKATFSFTRLPYSLRECVAMEGVNVAVGGAAPWFRVTGEGAHDGKAALRSGAIGDGESSCVEMQVRGEVEVSFWWKISSQNKVRADKHDYLAFSVDGEEVLTLGGGVIDWTNATYAVTGSGRHSLRWTYIKDGADASNEDCAWLDDVVWSPTGKLCAVSFDANGGEVSECERKVREGSSVGDLPVPNRSEHIFEGWFTEAEGGLEVSAASEIMDDITYYAHWKDGHFIITFDANGGTGGLSRTMVYGEPLSAPTVTRTGYTFVGWSQEVGTTVPASNAVYTAQWSVNQYTATFDANGGSGGKAVTQNYGTELVAPSVTRTGYSFVGWRPSVPTAMPAANRTFVAQWTANKYTVTFDPNGGTGGWSRQMDYGTEIAAPTPTREGYVFNYWLRGRRGDGYTIWYRPPIEAGEKITVADNVTYYAQWTDIAALTQCTVTFNANGGTGSTSRTIEKGVEVGNLPTPIRDGYAFAGWFTAPDGGTQISASTTATADVTYYAHWLVKGPVSFTIKDGVLTSVKLNNETDVMIPESVTSIGTAAFYLCRGLSVMTIPNSVTNIGVDAFRGCSGLTSVSIGNGVTSIGRCAFLGCKGLVSLTIPDSVMSIGDSAFYGCSGLTNLTIGNSVTNLERSAFSNCSSLTNVVIGSGVTDMGYGVFYGCGGLTSVIIPDSVTSIGHSAFYNCSSLTSVSLPGRLAGNLNSSVFAGCSNVEISYRDTSVVTLDATGGSVSTTSIIVLIGARVGELPTPTRDNDVFKGWYTAASGGVPISSDTVVTSDVTLYAHWGIKGTDSGVEFRIENGVLKDVNLNGSSKVTMPNSVTSIGSYAFYGCSGLMSVTIPNSVTSIGDSAFSGCSGLASVTIPNSVTRIGASAFSLCSGLTSVTIPDSVTSIGFSAFSHCSSLTSVTIPDSVASIGNCAFDGCSGLTSVTIPDSVTSIASSAFSYCSSLTSVTIPDSVTSIGSYAFWNCSGLTSVTIPDSVTSIEFGAFEDCSGLTSVTIPYSVTSIGGHAFYSCVALKSIYVSPGDADRVKGLMLNSGFDVNSANFIEIWMARVVFDANGGSVNEVSRSVASGSAVGVLPTPTRNGYSFIGWWNMVRGGAQITASTKVTKNVTYYAHWTKLSDSEPGDVPVLLEDVDGAVPAAASEYNGYLYDEKSGTVKGTIQVKVGKPGKKDGKAMVKATVVVGTKKITLKGAEMGKAAIASDEPTEIELVGKGAEECSVMLGAYGITGYYGAYIIDGARNIFSSKDKGDLAEANDALDKCLGSRMVIWDGGSVSVSIAAKGKVKVSGTLASGAKVSATAVLLVGEEWNCVSVAAPKANLSFVLWLSRDGKTTMVDGLGDDVLVGKAGTLADGAVFSVPADAALWSSIPGTVLTEYLPDGVPVTKKGTKWTLPKAGRITMKKGVIDVSKAGENPSGLKLTYKVKDGTFKGSFKVYAENKGKLKATTVNVTGFLLNGIGFGTATIKKVGSVSVRIE